MTLLAAALGDAVARMAVVDLPAGRTDEAQGRSDKAPAGKRQTMSRLSH